MAAEGTKGSGLAWFVRRGATVRGPFSSAKVRHFVIEGKLGFEDEVSADRKAWQPLGSVPEVVPLQMRDTGEGLEAERSDQRRGERVRAIRSILVVVAVIVGLVLAVSMVGSGRDDVPRDCARAPGPGVILEGCMLSKAEFAGASLVQANLANSDLSRANLSTADLQRADLRYADLSGADLSYARLGASVLLGATLRHADLTNADLSGVDLSFADLSDARIGGARFDGATLNGVIWIDGSRCGAGDCPR